MALKKDIELESGIIVNYHRIVSINKITNHTTIIEVASYISEKKRQEEIDYYNGKYESMNTFINTEYIEKEYDENDTIENLYEYLKTLDKSKDAEDA